MTAAARETRRGLVLVGRSGPRYTADITIGPLAAELSNVTMLHPADGWRPVCDRLVSLRLIDEIRYQDDASSENAA